MNEATTNTRKSARLFCSALVLLGLLCALYSASRRWQVETRNQAVEIVLDFAELRSLAFASGRDISDILRDFKKAGATSVALSEDTIGALEDAGQLTVLPALSPNSSRLQPANGDVSQRIQNALATRKQATFQPTTEGQLNINAAYAFIRGIGLGLDPQTAEAVKKADLLLVGRVSNWRGIRPDGITWTLENLKKAGIHTVIFTGDDVLGFKGYVTSDKENPGEVSTTSALQANGLMYGVVEFGKQKGDAVLARSAAPFAVRVHTVTGAEMVNADVASNVQRFRLAVRERNIRMLYVRLFPDEKEAVSENVRYVEKIARAIDPDEREKSGLELAPVHGYDELSVPLWVRFGIGLGLGAAWLLLVDSITGLFGLGVRALPFALTGLILAGLPLAGNMGVKLAALAASVVYPALAFLYTDHLREAEREGFGQGFVRFVKITGITTLGIAAIIGLLADRLFLLKVESFVGIKFSQLIPVLFIGLVLALDLRERPNRSFAQSVREARDRVVGFAASPVLFWQVGLALVALVLLAMLVLRSGNDPGVGVSGLELKVRSLPDLLL